jgi:hypothetical protein
MCAHRDEDGVMGVVMAGRKVTEADAFMIL